MAVDAPQIARRIAALAPDARRAFLRKLEERGLDFGELPIVAADRTRPLPLSVAQRSLWLAWRLDPSSSAYNMPGALRLDGPLDHAALGAAINALVERHEVLRTRLPADTVGEPFQEPLPSNGLAIDLIDVAHAAHDAVSTQLQAFAERPFRLDVEPPLRVTLFRHGDTAHTLMIVLHHIAGDGWSVRVLVDELFALYAAHRDGVAPALAPLPIQFADYAAWQRHWLDAGEASRQLEGWRARLGDDHPDLSLPLARARSGDAPSTEGRHRFTLTEAVAIQLKRLAHVEGASVYMVMLALFGLLLHRHTGQDDLRIGSPVANRRRAETHGLIGYLTNLQVLRLRIDPRASFLSLLASVREVVLDAQSRQDLPFDQLVDALKPPRRAGMHPLIQVKCTQQDEMPQPRDIAGLRVTLEEMSGGRSRFDLSFDFIDAADGLHAEFGYAAALFDVDTIARMAGDLQSFASQCVDHPDATIASLALASPAASLHGAQFGTPAPDVITLWDSFVSTSPQAPAVRDEHTAWTADELDRRANRLASRLRAAGARAGKHVAVHAERSCAFVLGVLATLKSGAAYVPLDPKLPAERLAAQFADCGATLLLSDIAPRWAISATRLALTGDDATSIEPRLPPSAIHADQPAYLIYTSGSTGRPKGVVISRGALATYVQSVLARLALPDDARSFAMVSTVAADLGHTSFFGALCSGRELHLIDAECAFDPDRFADYMAAHRIDVLKLVPSHMQALLQAAHPAGVLPRHRLVLGGEATPWALVDRIAALAPDCRVLNHYGPTETTVGVLTQPAALADREAATLPLGQPLDSVDALVLDAEMNHVPRGGFGELHLGGATVGQGYLGQPGLTAERFVAHPDGGGRRVYRSGDRVRQRPDGSLEFLGRMDDQVKIRGHRVEPGEVRAALMAQPDVADAVVIVKLASDGRAELHAYVAGKQGLSAEALRARLAERLTDAMVPSTFTFLSALPLTPNGKIDRRALPEPARANEEAPRELPQGGTEIALAEIWSEVLSLSAIGREDNFFALGGDSILSLKVVARARKRGLPLQPKQLMASPTLRALAATVSAATKTSAASTEQWPVRRARPTGPLPLSSAQARQWFLWKLDPQSTAYHIAGALTLRGQLDTTALCAGFEAIVARHEALRTVFQPTADGLAEQRIEPAGAFRVTVMDLESAGADPVGAEVDRLARTPFDLTIGPLLRVGLLKLGIDEHRLVVVLHHIVADGWSMQLIVDEFASQYAARIDGRADSLAPLPLQYADVALSQQHWIASAEREAELAYWRNELGTEQPVLHLPTDRARNPDGRYTAARHELRFPDDLVAGLRQRAQAEGATLFMTLLAGWQALLARWSHQLDVRVGVPIANRHRADSGGIVGLFVNTQVLRNELVPRASLHAVLRRARDAALGAQAHQDLPFEQLVEALQPERSLGTNALFQVMFNHQRKDHDPLRVLPGLTVEDAPLADDAAQFELSLDTREGQDGWLHASFHYAAELFDEDTIARLAQHYLRLLRAIAESPEQAWDAVDLFDDGERMRLASWSANPRRFDRAVPVHRLFEQQARTRPQAAALVFGDATLTYAELDARANQLAHRLIACGVAREARVGVAAERGVAMIVGVLAILKAGGAYVPLDPDYPADRLAHMISDAGVMLILANAGFGASVRTIDLDTLDVHAEPTHAPDVAVHGDQLAYVIYTSGSTGRPKGIALSHATLAEHCHVAVDYFGLAPGERVLQFSTINFDGFVEQLFPALVCGAAIVLRGPTLWDAEAFRREIVAHGVTVADLPTAYWHLVAREFATRPGKDWGSLRQVQATGEAMPAEGLGAWRDAGLAHVKLLNTYGPTETAVTATAHDCSPYLSVASPIPSHVPIGKPLAGRRLHVLDGALNATPLGVAGELYIGGALLARGYHARPALSAERFVADPFDPHGGRLYRTGDLARWDARGELEYLGRVDHQVKLRGYRIELGEVEARLRSLPGVREALVIDQRTADGLQLVGYACGEALRPDALRAQLAEVLPDYMVPAAVLVLDALPMTPNGKLDRNRLPRVEFAQRSHDEPRSDTERAVAAIWRELLGFDHIGRDDHFFEIGGHSLRAIQLLARVREREDVDLPLRTVFEKPRLHEFARAIDDRRAAKSGCMRPDETPLRVVARRDSMPLSPAQQRLWLVDRLTPAADRTNLSAYHMHAALRLRGSLSVPALQASLAAIVDRHELLRTSYGEDDDGDPVAHISPRIDLPLPLTDLAGLTSDARLAWVARAMAEHATLPFDLHQPPLLRASLLRLADDDHLLLLCVHHIAFDGWSQSVFIGDLVAIYPALARGESNPLALLASQYADYADWHSRTLAATRDRDNTFWRSELVGAPVSSTLPADPGIEPSGERSGSDLTTSIAPVLTKTLGELARAHDTSLFTLLYAAFALWLHAEAGSDDLVIGTDVAGRARHEFESLIGFFVNVVPLRSRRSPGMTFAQWLVQAKERSLRAFEHAERPLDQIIECLDLPRQRGHAPLVQVLFVMQNVPERLIELPGLRVEIVDQPTTQAKFDLAVFATEADGAVQVRWVFAEGRYTRDRIECAADGLASLLRRIAVDPTALLDALLARPEPASLPSSSTTDMNSEPPRRSSKLDKLKRLGSAGAAPAERPRARVRTSFLAPDREFPLVLEADSREIDPVAWAREQRDFIETALCRHGGVLFRGFGLDTPQDFEAFAEIIEPGLYGQYGDLPKKEGGRNIYRSTPYPEQQMILFHNESAHLERWPRKQWFFCELPSPVGGATPIVDGREMLRRLPARLVAEFERKGLQYVRTFTPRLDVDWRDFFKTDDRDDVMERLRHAGTDARWLDEHTLQTRTRCPAVIRHPVTGERVFFNQVQLHHPSCLEPQVRADLLAMVGADRLPRQVLFGDGSPIGDDTMALIGQAYEDCAVRFDWRRGDVVMLDNMIAAHARDPYEGPRKIVVAMGAMFDRAHLDRATPSLASASASASAMAPYARPELQG